MHKERHFGLRFSVICIVLTLATAAVSLVACTDTSSSPNPNTQNMRRFHSQHQHEPHGHDSRGTLSFSQSIEDSRAIERSATSFFTHRILVNIGRRRHQRSAQCRLILSQTKGLTGCCIYTISLPMKETKNSVAG